MDKSGTSLLPLTRTLADGKVIIFRLAQEADAEACIAYLDCVSAESDFLSFGPGEFEISLEDERALIARLRQSENGIFLIADHNEVIAGILTFEGGPRPRTKHTGEFGISVAMPFWGLGIGRQMIQILIEWAEINPIVQKLNLRVRADNKRAIRLYTSLGFEEEGKITRDICINGKFYDCLMMGLKL